MSECMKKSCDIEAQDEYTGINSKDSLFEEFGDYIPLCDKHAKELLEISRKWLNTK